MTYDYKKIRLCGLKRELRAAEDGIAQALANARVPNDVVQRPNVRAHAGLAIDRIRNAIEYYDAVRAEIALEEKVHA